MQLASLVGGETDTRALCRRYVDFAKNAHQEKTCTVLDSCAMRSVIVANIVCAMQEDGAKSK